MLCAKCLKPKGETAAVRAVVAVREKKNKKSDMVLTDKTSLKK